MTIPAHRITFGEHLRGLCHERGWSSQEAFADHVGLDCTYISGSRRIPTLDVIVKLAHALDVKPAEHLSTIE